MTEGFASPNRSMCGIHLARPGKGFSSARAAVRACGQRHGASGPGAWFWRAGKRPMASNRFHPGMRTLYLGIGWVIRSK